MLNGWLHTPLCLDSNSEVSKLDNRNPLSDRRLPEFTRAISYQIWICSGIGSGVASVAGLP